ncbi:hypothetical protein HUB98_26555 [Paenibacillus barcinonensis]|uniref:Uncharacterized protein n=1 Tax=Paenibacillus barcinonensis TaxID=198119 RepID=A0A2V4W248_PAEBA|nr:hypothetical protein [Paenibacillus barcinonensis]PYE52483.1 hypothetical protein DFQ00_101421 [Paenibacillus barcinonensis]QKS59355.1 hypothetical protein HUB98_26225 [Paenibacillus barcinonensis]QKS59413.1 hypothetical protein HUB98_26555 [Paenibacillus barcinonensis]
MTIKLIEAASTTSASYPYEVPTGKYSLIKSLVICNLSGTENSTVSVHLGGTYLVYSYALKGGDSLIIEDLELFLLAGERILIQHNGVTSFRISVTVEEKDYDASNFPYKKVNGLATGGSPFVIQDDGSDWIIKAMYIINPNPTDLLFAFYGQFVLINNKKLGPSKSLIIPKSNIMMTKGRTYTFSGNKNCYIGLILEKVVQ